MIYDFILKLLGIKNNNSEINKNIVKKLHPVSNHHVKFSTPSFDLNSTNVVHPELKNKKEIEDLYSEIRILQEKNRQKINKNKISYKIEK